MISEIQTAAKLLTPLSIEEIVLNDTNLILRGVNWHFSVVAAWRLIKNDKFLVGSDLNALDLSHLLKDAAIVDIIPQSSSFPVDPTFLFNNGTILEFFSDASFDTWTFQLPDTPLYDFNPYNEPYNKTQPTTKFPEITGLLPLLHDISLENDKLILKFNNWKLVVSSSWRFTDQNSNIYGASEERGKEILPECKNLSIESVYVQSHLFPIDPILHFSNGIRLEIFSANPDKSWKIMQIH